MESEFPECNINPDANLESFAWYLHCGLHDVSWHGLGELLYPGIVPWRESNHRAWKTMILAVSAAEVERRRTRIGAAAAPSWRTNFFGTFGVTAEDGPPMAFRVEMGAEAVTKPHFHEVDQYQVFLAGRGRFGRHEIATLGVHYADHHSAYGPIIAGEGGFAYLTLRPRQDSRIIYVDEAGSRARLLPSKKRQHTIADVSLCIEPVMAGRDVPLLEPLIEAQPDGLAAWVLRLGAGVSANVPGPTPSGGTYVYAANGSFIAGSGACPARSLMWFGPDDKVAVTAGSAGLEALLLRFPRDGAGSAHEAA